MTIRPDRDRESFITYVEKEVVWNKGLVFVAVFVFALAAALYQADEANAAPTFERQTSMARGTCHFQHFPSLHAFCRAFKAGCYTMIGGQSMVEG